MSEPTLSCLLVTDVVDSTRLVQELGDAVSAQLWADHDRLSRALLEPHRGLEIDKTDGFLLLFEQVHDAVRYAVAYHAALATLEPPLSARAGIHVAPVHLRQNPAEDVARGAKPLEVDGLAKSVAARVMSVARGGQTLLTPEAVAAATPLPDPMVAMSHGHWRLKGVAAPVELTEVGVEGEAPFVPPPDGAKVWRVQRHGDAWVTLRDVPHRLPRERDAFLGRARGLSRLASTLDEGVPLVTLLGPGGTGKTRMALHYAWTWLGGWPGGAWFCDLSDARDALGIVTALAASLDVDLGAQDGVVALGHALQDLGRGLVILDNFEQVVGVALDTVGAWLDAAPDVQFVVTSREALGVPGETVIPLAPLEVASAVALFDARARQVKPSHEADPATVEALVELLDRLPLAIELAAARVTMMPPTKLLARIGDRFRLLRGKGRAGRHATLRATIDWSWDLLDEEERQALTQLCVFDGGFTLEAAEAVVETGDAWPTDLVQSLVDKSLVQPAEHERFRLLVSVQEYGLSRADDVGGVVDAEARHGGWFAVWGTSSSMRPLLQHGGLERRQAALRDLDNLFAACRRATARGEPDVAVPVLRILSFLTAERGPLERMVQPLAEVGRLPGLAGQNAAIVRGLEGLLAMRQGRMAEARDGFERAAVAYRAVDEPEREAEILGSLAVVQIHLGEPETALATMEDALERFRQLGRRDTEGSVLANMGILSRQLGRLEAAEGRLLEALAIHREMGHHSGEGNVLGSLGEVCLDLGRVDDARTHLDQALAICREGGNRVGEGAALRALARLHRAQGDTTAAVAALQAAVTTSRELGAGLEEVRSLESLGDVLLEAGDRDGATSALTEAVERAADLGDASLLDELDRKLAGCGGDNGST